MKLLPSRRVLCTPYNHAPRHFMQRHNPLQDLSYSYAPHVCRTVHTHTLQTSAGQVKPIHSRLLQDRSYPYTPDFCRTVHTHTLDFCGTVHTHTLQTAAGQFIPILSRLLQDSSYPYTRLLRDSSYPCTRLLRDSSYPYTPDCCRTGHTHTLQTSAGQFIPIHSRHLQDSSYPYSPDFCRTVHTHTLQTSAGQFIPIYSRLLKEQFIPLHFARQFSPASSSNSYVPTSFRHVILCFDWLNA